MPASVPTTAALPASEQPPTATALTQASIALADETATERLAQTLAAQGQALAQVSIHLYGALGAGKTSWVRHLLRALGVRGRIKSPTYALLESYALDHPPEQVHHFDLYRLETPQEWLDSGLLETVQGAGLKLIEWPQKAGDALPLPDLALHLQFVPQQPQQRQLALLAYSPAGQALAKNMLQCAL